MSESPKNILALIAALEDLKDNRKQLLVEDRDLFDECRRVFEKLKLLSDFDENDLSKVINILGSLSVEIQNQNIEEIGVEADDLESIVPDKMKLQELEDAYDDAIRSKNEKNVKKIGDEIYKRTGHKNVDQFIKTQKEIAARNKDQLDKLEPELRQKVSQDIAKISEDQQEKIAKAIENSVQKDKEVKKKEVEKEVEKKQEEITKTVEDSILDNKEIKKKELEKEIKKVIKDQEEVDKVIKKIEEVRAEIKVETKAEEIATKTYEKLKSENIPISEKTKDDLKQEILVAIRNSEELKMPKELVERSQDVTVVEAIKEVEKFKTENLEDVVNYRAQELEKEIGYDLRRSGVTDETIIKEYISVVNELTYNPETTRFEVNNQQIEDEVNAYLAGDEEEGRPPIVPKLKPEFATEEAEFMAKNVTMAPKKFNKLVKRYNKVREKLEEAGVGIDKLPKMKETRVVEKLMNQFNQYPQVLRMMNGAQRMMGFLDKVNGLPAGLVGRVVSSKAGEGALRMIGGQVAGEFVKQAAIVLAEQGTAQGIRSIATAIMTGAVPAGSSAALAGALAAFQALPVIGQVAAVVVGIVLLVKPIVDGVKNFIGKTLKVDMNGVKHFLSDTLGLGGFVGGVGQFVADIALFLIGIPTLFSLISITAIITPVITFFFLGTLTYSMFQHNLISSIVPPADMSNCILKGEAQSGITNCDPNAPENSWSAVNKANFIDVANRWQAGSNLASICYNDTVNRALCAGINPTYALWTWLHESGASNYSRDDIEDFGIHFITENNNYNAQITAFLKLDPGRACINDPRIGGDYWLAFSANFLNGDCDPDRGNSIFPDMTPRKYAAELRETWGWISNAPMPKDIHVPKGGKDCGSVKKLQPITGKEVVDAEGNVWICYKEKGLVPIPEFDPWDPNIPVPEGCPDRRPSAGYFTQGPFAKGCSHQSMSIPAIDLGTADGTPIVATHPGVAVLGYDSIYGFYIDVHGKCEGKDFYSRYAHMPQGGYRVGNNSTVKAGQQIGVVNNTGSSTGPHLHYHISGLDTNKFGQYLGLSVAETKQLWGCCGSWNGVACP